MKKYVYFIASFYSAPVLETSVLVIVLLYKHITYSFQYAVIACILLFVIHAFSCQSVNGNRG